MSHRLPFVLMRGHSAWSSPSGTLAGDVYHSQKGQQGKRKTHLDTEMSVYTAFCKWKGMIHGIVG